MKFDLENARADKFERIFQKKNTYPHECKLRMRLEDEEPIQVEEMIKWLETNTIGRWQMITEEQNLWGFAFQNKKDAMLWRLTWS